MEFIFQKSSTDTIKIRKAITAGYFYNVSKLDNTGRLQGSRFFGFFGAKKTSKCFSNVPAQKLEQISLFSTFALFLVDPLKVVLLLKNKNNVISYEIGEILMPRFL